MKRFAKTSCVFVLLIAVFLMFSSLSFADEDINQKILDLRKQIAELEKQAEQYKNAIGQKQKQAQTLAREIAILTDQIKRLESSIKLNEVQIETKEVEIVDLNEKIYDALMDIEEKKEAIGTIISQMNERDSENFMTILLKNNKLSEFFNQMQYDERLQRSLVVNLINLKVEKEELQKNRDNVEDKKEELEGLNASLANRKVSLSGTVYGKDNLLDKTKGEEVRYQALLSEVERKQAAFFNELQKLEKEAVATGAYILRIQSPIPAKAKIFEWPEDDYVFTQSYGYTKFSRSGAYGGAPHNGIDIASGYGTPIKAIGNGKILVGGNNEGWGNWVAILHDNGLVSLYAHMNKPCTLPNSTPVKTGDIIGYEGTTGFVTGSHLHLSIYHEFFTYINDRNGQVYFNYFDGTLNPLDYLR